MEPGAPTPLDACRVLVVDDDPLVGETVAQLLEADGLRVRVVLDAESALADLRAHECDVVVSDVFMPGLTGLDLLAEIRRIDSPAELVLMSAAPTFETAREAVRRGAFDYLAKPLEADVLLRVVRDAHSRRRRRATSAGEAQRAQARLKELETAVLARGRELRESRERYQQLVEDLPLVVFEIDLATRRFTYVGGRLAATLGGEAWLGHVDPEDQTRFWQLVEAPDGADASVDQDLRSGGDTAGVRWLRVVGATPSRGDVRRVSGFVLDVTAQRLAQDARATLERELNDARAALERALVRSLDVGVGSRAVRIEDGKNVEPPAFELGRSAAMKRVGQEATLATEHDEPVLVTGETGTGKGVLAEWIHARGTRAKGSFVAVNCSCLRGELLESELFGHVRGAFTSAIKDRRGLIEEAHGGTLFLDEIGEMEPETQAKLLKVLEDRTFRRVGDTTPRKSDFRLVCATNRDLADEVARGRFRADLLFRINVFTIRMPPLREREGDIELLARHLLVPMRQSRAKVELAEDAVAALESYAWPGNVRELRNVLVRAALLARGAPIGPEHLDLFDRDRAPAMPAPGVSRNAARPASEPGASVPPDGAEGEEDEPERLRALATRFDGNVAKMARELGITRQALYRRLERHGIEIRR